MTTKSQPINETHEDWINEVDQNTRDVWGHLFRIAYRLYGDQLINSLNDIAVDLDLIREFVLDALALNETQTFLWGCTAGKAVNTTFARKHQYYRLECDDLILVCSITGRDKDKKIISHFEQITEEQLHERFGQ